ncbi:LON peptidase substrate-binding domain-containing protein, partial [Mycobacterium tuberculosis]|nr:LON peptidase substrate-binding domain-containing protein [Mycobacterium tuberculosis]
MLVAEKPAAKDDPTEKDMYEVGSIANILQMLKLPDGTVKVLVEGLQRCDTERDRFLSAAEAVEYGLVDSILTHRN